MLPVTSAIAAFAAVALVVLSVSVSLRRMAVGTRIGFGDDELLLRRIRAQGNFTEYMPLALILTGLAEYRGASAMLLYSMAALFIAGRVLHAAGILSGRSAIRAPGMLCTYTVLLLGAGALLLA